jgi:hypothetical protein
MRLGRRREFAAGQSRLRRPVASDLDGRGLCESRDPRVLCGLPGWVDPPARVDDLASALADRAAWERAERAVRRLLT